MDRKKRRRKAKAAVISAALFIMIVFFFMRAACLLVLVSGASMEPAFHDGDILYAVKPLRPSAVRRGDVIVFTRPGGGEELIKRVIGLPGERLTFVKGAAFADGLWIPDGRTGGFPEDAVTLFAEEYYVLGDNRDVSVDSRSFGPVAYHDIKGVIKGKAGWLSALYAFLGK